MVTQSSQWQINSSVYLFCFSVLTVVITQGFFILFWLRKAMYRWFTSSCLMLNPSFPGGSLRQWSEPPCCVQLGWAVLPSVCIQLGSLQGSIAKHQGVMATLHSLQPFIFPLLCMFFSFLVVVVICFFFPLSYKELVAHSGFECSLCLFLFCSRL